MEVPRSKVLRRLHQVVRVFSRHGFGLPGAWLGLSRSRLSGAADGEREPSIRGERLRSACEELGPAFVKLGQMLSTRGDLLPSDITAALERLQDRVAPVPFEQVQKVLEEELDGPLDEHFAAVTPEPVAAASLAQVHRAVLPDGREVVLKVQRPGVAEQVELDLAVLQRLAGLAARRSNMARHLDLPGVARELAAMLRRELDFEQEGRSAERFRENFDGDPEVRFPAVVWERTSRRVLTLERVGGIRITDRAGLREAGLEPSEVAGRLTGALFRMALRDGFFHADPHPGNLFVSPEGAMIFVDMGMVGELTPPMRANVVEYVLGVVGRDPDQVVRAIQRMGMLRQPGQTAALRREMERLQDRYGEVPLQQVEIGSLLREMMAVARRYRITFPVAYTVLLRAVTTLEAVVRQVDPDATLVGLAAPHTARLLEERHEPERLVRRLGREMLDAGRYAARLPRQASRVLSLLEEGEARIAVDHAGLEPALHRLSAIANRLAIAILLASLIIGTALVGSGAEDSFLDRYPIADAGFLLIGSVGLWLIWSILTSGRA